MTSRVMFSAVLIIVLSHVTAWGAEPGVPKQVRYPVDTPFEYARGILVVSSKGGTAAIEFLKPHDDGSWEYRFRYRPNDPAGAEVTGTGTVSPVVPKPADRPTRKTGTSGPAMDDIVAGDLAVLWGKGGRDWGWIHYVPEEMTVQIVSMSFEKLELARFQR